MKYFVTITQDHWTAKNGLQSAIRKTAKEYNHTLIHGSESRTKWLTQFKAAINEAHFANKACKAMEIHQWFPDKNKDEMHICVSNVFYMVIYPVAQEMRVPKGGQS